MDIWEAVEWFVRSDCSDDSHERLLARIAIILSLCEGVLQWGLSNIDVQPYGTRQWSWSIAKSTLTRFLGQQEKISGTDEWKWSRGFIRARLIDIDQTIVASNAEDGKGTHARTRADGARKRCLDYLVTLEELSACANHNQDVCLISAIRCRMECLSEDTSTHILGDFMIAIPVDAYMEFREGNFDRERINEIEVYGTTQSSNGRDNDSFGAKRKDDNRPINDTDRTSLEDLNNDDRVRAFGIINRLYELGINENIPLPQVKTRSLALHGRFSLTIQ